MDAQADLSLRWVHSHFVGFVMSRLIYISSDNTFCKISNRMSGVYFRKMNNADKQDSWQDRMRGSWNDHYMEYKYMWATAR